jgi:hypothetical protein
MRDPGFDAIPGRNVACPEFTRAALEIFVGPQSRLLHAIGSGALGVNTRRQALPIF